VKPYLGKKKKSVGRVTQGVRLSSNPSTTKKKKKRKRRRRMVLSIARMEKFETPVRYSGVEQSRI
jgi:hypothetical protein